MAGPSRVRQRNAHVKWWISHVFFFFLLVEFHSRGSATNIATMYSFNIFSLFLMPPTLGSLSVITWSTVARRSTKLLAQNIVDIYQIALWLFWLRTCVIQEYRYYTMSLSQYQGFCESMYKPWVHVDTMSSCLKHWLCLYNEPMSIPWVHFYTINPCLYHESMSIPWVLVNSMRPCLYHESLLIAWVLVYSMRPCLYHESLLKAGVNVYTMSPELQFTEI